MKHNIMIIEQKLDNVKNAIWEIALSERKMSSEHIRWLGSCYDAKKALELVHDELLEDEAERTQCIEKKMKEHKHGEEHKSNEDHTMHEGTKYPDKV